MATILLIDDSESLLAHIREMLRTGGHGVVAELSGAHAIPHLRSATIDLVLTDLYMPPPDGFEVLQAVHKLAPHVPVIVMSTNPLPCDVFRAARALGAAATLQKPFGPETLLPTVHAALTNRRRFGERDRPDARPPRVAPFNPRMS